MSLFMSQEEMFRSIMDYFAGTPVKILACNKPSYIRAEIRSCFSQNWPSYVRVEATVARRNGGSQVHFNFDSSKEYIAGSVFAILMALLCYGVLSWVFSLITLELSYSTIRTLPILAAVFTFFITMAFESYNISLTKKRFIGEFSTFAQSLSAHLSPSKD
ncbi:MAG: hypothetical protein OEZ21_05185 [Candidatus Bathyarchaeota archaeon]|nr:hypothetical protein [Candidatus Bathyarchaeota archaeon]